MCLAYAHFCWPWGCGAWVSPGSSRGRSPGSWSPPLSADPPVPGRPASWMTPWLRVRTCTHTRWLCHHNMWQQNVWRNLDRQVFQLIKALLTCLGRNFDFFRIWSKTNKNVLHRMQILNYVCLFFDFLHLLFLGGRKKVTHSSFISINVLALSLCRDQKPAWL